MKETYTSAEARAALHVDAKTFLRWLKQAGMEPQVSKADHRIKVFTHEQIERMADEHERSLQGEHTLSTDERLAALESRLERIEQVILSLGSAEKPARKRATETPGPHEAPTDIPAGSIRATEFAAAHNVHPRTFKDHLYKSKVPSIKMPRLNRPREFEYWLTPEQQQVAIDYWQEIGTTFETRPDLYPHLSYYVP